MASQTLSWNKIIKKPLTQKEISSIYTALAEASDQTVALVLGTMLERLLEYAIASRMVQMKHRAYRGIFDGGFLQGFEAKTKIGYALGLYGLRTWEEIDRIREIRNVFAHSIHRVRFATRRIARHCQKLTSCDDRLTEVLTMLTPGPKYKSNKPRHRYMYATTVLWVALSMASEKSKRPRRPRLTYCRIYLP